MTKEYQLVANFNGVRRTSDSAAIPNTPGNRDWLAYQEWLAAGNEPEPAPPPPRPEPTELPQLRVADPENYADAVNLRTLDARLEEINHRIDEIAEGRR